MLNPNIIFIGVIVNLFCSLWYVKSIIKGNTKPNIISFFIWMLAPCIAVFLELKAGSHLEILGTFMAGFGPLLVVLFFLFRKNNFWKINTFDIVCGFLSIFALIFYIITKNISISILFAILSDFIAYIPTYKKTLKDGDTENPSIYLGGIFTNILVLFVIKDWNFAIYSFSIYLITANLIEIYFIYRKKIFKKLIFS